MAKPKVTRRASTRHRANGHAPVKELLKLNLACGQNPVEGFLGVDKYAGPGVDLVLDLEKFPWPWEDESVAEVVCSHFIEHTADFVGFMDELWRVLVPGGKATIIAPYYASSRAFQDPTHKRYICEASFLYANRQWREQNGLAHYLGKCNFGFSYAYAMTPEWAARSEEARNFAIKHYINVINDLHVFLTKEP